MADSTVSDVFARATRRPPARPGTVLYVAYQLNDAAAPPSRHKLDGIEQVAFGRGPRSVTRRALDGRPGLVIQLPDPVMSADHGRLIHRGGGWRLEDPHSKNGAVVDGRATRVAQLKPGAVLQLGHTIFLIDQATLSDDHPADLIAAPVAAPRAELVTLDPRLAADVADLERVATRDVPILLSGETGTGKEVIARAIHALSRRPGELIAVNCGAIPATLMESELFGHKRGAFSGAVADRLGHLRAADHGTVFLDEIGELPPVGQAALLRALQQREVVPVGESSPVAVDLRVIAASHRDLTAMIGDGRFREDLYARLLGVTIALPALRDRRFDLGLVTTTLLRRLDPSGQARLTPAAARALFAYDWPRNIRELERALAGGLARSSDGAIDLAQLPDAIQACGAADEPSPAPPPTADSREDHALRAELIAALDQHAGNVTAAARALGKHREQVHRWARRLGIDLESFRR